MSNTCERPFITEDEAKKCEKPSEILISKGAQTVVKLLKTNNADHGLQFDEECTISAIADIINKLNPDSKGIITEDEKIYLLSFLNEASTQEKLKKVLTRVLITIKDKDTFLSKTFFDKGGNIDLEKFISSIKDFINKYDSIEGVGFSHIIDNLYVGWDDPSGKQGFYIKESNGLVKLDDYLFDSIYGVSHYYSLDFIRVKNNHKEGLLKYNMEKGELISILDVDYDDIIIEDSGVFIVEKDGKQGLLLNNKETGITTCQLDTKYDNIFLEKDGTIVVELDGKKGYFRIENGKLITLLDFSGLTKRVAYNLGLLK